MFDKFDEQTVKTILASQQEARRQGHKFVDVEQLLLGLMSNPESVPFRVLQRLGLKVQTVRKRINDTLGCGRDFVGVETPFTPRLQILFESALERARQSGKTMIDTRDLLLALAQVSDGIAGEILKDADITIDSITGAIEKL